MYSFPATTVTWKQYEYGKVSFDRTHIFAASYNLQAPWFATSKGFVGGALKGWELSGITRYQSGAPLTITGSSQVGPSDPNQSTGLVQYGRRASVVPGTSAPFTCPAHRVCLFNPNAYTTAPTTSAGDAPIGNIIGPSYFNWDVSLRKTFHLPREGMALMFQVDAFNIFNKTNWLNPGTSANGGAGQIASANPPRQLQFGGNLASKAVLDKLCSLGGPCGTGESWKREVRQGTAQSANPLSIAHLTLYSPSENLS